MPWIKSQIARVSFDMEIISTDAHGRFLLCGSEKGGAKLWNIEKEPKLIFRSDELGKVLSTTVSWDGEFGGILAEEGLFVIKTSGPDPVKLDFPGSIARSISAIPETSIAVVGASKMLILVDLKQQQVIEQFEHPDVNYDQLITHPDGSILAGITKWSKSVDVWQLNPFKKLKSVGEYHKSIADFVFLAGEGQIAVVCHEIEGHIWDLASNTTVRTLPRAQGVEVNSNEKYLALSQEFSVRIENLENGETEYLKENSYLWNMVGAPLSNVLVTVGGGEIVKWDLEIPQSKLAEEVLESKNWVPLALDYFRELGFFRSTSSSERSSFDELITEFQARLSRDSSNAREVDLVLLLALDRNRIWWDDTEIVYHDQVYTEVLNEWSNISEGQFNPIAIDERWSEDNSSVSLSFEFEGELRTIQRSVSGDWLDLSILADINQLIVGTGHQFVLFNEPRDQTAVVACISQATRVKLQHELGISFEEPNW
jgi:hypothetical protein